jgi:hypothetical protein
MLYDKSLKDWEEIAVLLSWFYTNIHLSVPYLESTWYETEPRTRSTHVFTICLSAHKQMPVFEIPTVVTTKLFFSGL